MKTGFLCGVALWLSASGAGAQAGSMFADPKATDVGDAVTVIISENASASNQTSTKTEKTNEVEITSNVPGGGNVLGFVPLHALESTLDNQYEGRGTTSRSARLTARISVTVVGRRPNGDLILDGVRTLKINGETEAIHLSGAVDPVLIRADNTVPSSSVSDLIIEYTGKGTITQGSRPGIFVRLVNWLF